MKFIYLIPLIGSCIISSNLAHAQGNNISETTFLKDPEYRLAKKQMQSILAKEPTKELIAANKAIYLLDARNRISRSTPHYVLSRVGTSLLPLLRQFYSDSEIISDDVGVKIINYTTALIAICGGNKGMEKLKKSNPKLHYRCQIVGLPLLLNVLTIEQMSKQKNHSLVAYHNALLFDGLTYETLNPNLAARVYNFQACTMNSNNLIRDAYNYKEECMRIRDLNNAAQTIGFREYYEKIYKDSVKETAFYNEDIAKQVISSKK